VDDNARLEALRSMHHNHQVAGRLALSKALAVLQALPLDHIPGGAAVRLLDVGTRLERETLTTSVAEMQGRPPSEPEIEDPWEVIAREFQAPLADGRQVPHHGGVATRCAGITTHVLSTDK
jgi:hypothetical protein